MEALRNQTLLLSESRLGSLVPGIPVAVFLPLAVEATLPTDAVLYRLRSVFTAGRAMDKVLYVEARPPSLLILANSRADNGFDPRTVAAHWTLQSSRPVFNPGLPGADARVLAGIVKQLDEDGLLGGNGIRHVLVSLDEALVQKVDTLGQEVFFTDRTWMWADGQYLDWFRSLLRLYGYVDNASGLRGPGTLGRCLRAISHDVDRMGGSAAQHLGSAGSEFPLHGKRAIHPPFCPAHLSRLCWSR